MKSKPKAEPSVQDETEFHIHPKLASGMVAGEQASAGSIVGASWDVLEAELDGRMRNRALNKSDVRISTAMGEPEAELEKCMNGSVKHLNKLKSAQWGELEAEIERRMSGCLKDVDMPGSIPTDEKETPLSSEKDGSKSSLIKVPKEKCEPPGRSHVAKKGQQTCQKSDVKSDAKTPNSEKRPPQDNKLPKGGLSLEEDTDEESEKGRFQVNNVDFIIH